ncbi:UTRA domain-containing protein [Kitasatospora aburaviensis]
MSKYERKSPRIVAELLDEISSGKRRPGEQFLTIAQLAEKYDVSPNTASGVIKQLKTLGALSGKTGGKTWVRVPPVPAKRTPSGTWRRRPARLWWTPASVAPSVSASTTPASPSGRCTTTVSAWTWWSRPRMSPPSCASAPERVRRVIYERRHQEHAGLSRSTSYVPYELIKDNPDLLNSELLANWPGGMMHELRTVGIEAGEIVDHVSVTVPTAEESHDYDIPPGVPLIHIRKVTFDITGRPVEVADIPLPGDRVELIFRTPLPRWAE